MAWWNGQMAKGDYTLQFGTELKKEYQYIEKCCQKVMDNAYGWISVKDRLPVIGQRVICYCVGGMQLVLKFTENNDWYENDKHCYFLSFVTYWQPLPEPPESEV